ncbi:hypothetical protein ACIRRA_45285 [Nocardia sp. NPDC101769]|uniref:hypothetical protein n=1 Tax=Nocardia sp. NPDC101769 TaxID=3364333 RepID=UPI00382E6237
MSGAAVGGGPLQPPPPVPDQDIYSPNSGDTLTNTDNQQDAQAGLSDLYPGDSLVSKNGLYRLTFEHNGQVVIAGPGGNASSLSAKRVAPDPAHPNARPVLRFQNDGNLVVYPSAADATAKNAVWAAGSNWSGDHNGTKGELLSEDRRPRSVQLSDDGRLLFWDNTNPSSGKLIGSIDLGPLTLNGGLAKPEDASHHTGKWDTILPVPVNVKPDDPLAASISETSWHLQTLVDMMGGDNPIVVPFVKNTLKAKSEADLRAEFEAGAAQGLSGAALTSYQQDLASKLQQAADWANIDKKYQDAAHKADLEKTAQFKTIKNAVDTLKGELEQIGPRSGRKDDLTWPPLTKETQDYIYRRLSDVLATVIDAVTSYERTFHGLAAGLPLPTERDPKAPANLPGKPPEKPKPPHHSTPHHPGSAKHKPATTHKHAATHHPATHKPAAAHKPVEEPEETPDSDDRTTSPVVSPPKAQRPNPVHRKVPVPSGAAGFPQQGHSNQQKKHPWQSRGAVSSQPPASTSRGSVTQPSNPGRSADGSEAAST